MRIHNYTGKIPPSELSPVERACIVRMDATTDLFGIEAERLEGGTLMLIAWHAVREAFVVVFVVAEIPPEEALDEFYDWCQSELANYRRREIEHAIAQGQDRESVEAADQFPWFMGLACARQAVVTDQLEDDLVVHYEELDWTLELHLIPREVLEDEDEA